MSGNTSRKRVRGYYRGDGTYVRGHYRSRPGAGGPPSRGGGSPGGGGLLLFVIIIVVLGMIAEAS